MCITNVLQDMCLLRYYWRFVQPAKKKKHFHVWTWLKTAYPDCGNVTDAVCDTAIWLIEKSNYNIKK